jgi:hypothetical protein
MRKYEIFCKINHINFVYIIIFFFYLINILRISIITIANFFVFCISM